MNPSPPPVGAADSLDAVFAGDLDRQTQCYEEACVVAEGIASGLRKRQDIDEKLASLSTLMQHVAQLANDAAENQQRWQAMRTKASPQLSAAYHRYTSTLKRLIDIVQAAEATAIEARNQLQPEVDAGVKSRRVMSRYHDSLKL